MRILMVDGARGWGGAEEIVLMLSSRLRNAGHSVTVLVRKGSSSDGRFTDAGFPVRRFNGKGIGGIARLAALHLRAHREGFDLIHVHRNHDLIMARTLSVAAGRIPLLLTQHCLLGKTSSFLIDLADQIVAVSDFIRSDMTERFPALAGKLEVLHNGVDLRSFEKPAPGYWDNVPFLAGKRPLLGAVGLFYKNQEELIDMLPAVLERLPEAALVLIGSDEVQRRQELEARAALRGVSDAVWFAGKIPYASMESALAGLDLNISAFRTEGFGLSVVEGFAVGTPFVGFRAGGYPEIVDDGVTGCLAESTDQMALKLVSLLERPEELSVMGENAKKIAAGRFALDLMVAKYESIYRTMVSRFRVGGIQ
jgi:glycosyltransferase involved in cell wall biosynthesis